MKCIVIAYMMAWRFPLASSIASNTFLRSRGVLPVGGSTDLDIRFSKITFVDAKYERLLPLNREDYPMEGGLCRLLQQSSTGVSVITEDDPEVEGMDLDRYVRAIGGGPTFPDKDEKHPFWEDMRQVVRAQIDRRAGRDLSGVVRLPKLWENYTIDEIAENVRSDYPGYWQSKLLVQLFEQGVAVDNEVLPFRSRFDFVGGLVRMADINTWAIGYIAPVNFLAKWKYGRPRPEEVAWRIRTGEITTGVPNDIVDILRGWNMSKPSDFTAYPEGSPRHPSWPAMHSAASSASLWMAVVFDLTEAQYCEALLTDYIVSYGRTVAGVHYPTDNLAGLNLGQEILAEGLVDHLVERFGADRQATRAKLARKRFDWNDFDPLTCTIA